MKEKENGNSGIVNTTKLAKERPGAILAAFLVDTGYTVEKMEALGAEQLRNQRTVLPTKGLANDRERWGKIGVEVGTICSEDPLFTQAVLPDSWTIEEGSSSSDYWSVLKDENGYVRAKLFYKAAFYDRRASINLVPRYGVTRNRKEERWVVRDEKHPEPYLFSGDADADVNSDPCYAWLDEHFPDWKNPLAYWGEEATTYRE